jgi:hypothetical protein
VRTSRRVGPDGQVVFDLIAEVTQRRQVRPRNGQRGFDFYGGATAIIGPRGEVRYVIAKSVWNKERLEQQRAFMTGSGKKFWSSQGHHLQPDTKLFQLLHNEEIAAYH